MSSARRPWCWPPGFTSRCCRCGTPCRGIALADDLGRSGAALVSTTRLAGRHAVRLCILNPTSSDDDVRHVIEHFAGAPAPAAGPRDPAAFADSRAGTVADPDTDLLRAVPLLSGVADSTIQAIRARAVRRDTAAAEEVTRRWDADRSFYIILSGRYEVFIDARPIRTLGPGDHFGELAARDWGGGYGYARLATVSCAEPGRLLQLASEDFQWLVDTERVVKARLAQIVVERLQQR
jgi:Cyclic nucleotide-binding domain